MKALVREFWIERTLDRLPPSRIDEARAWINEQMSADTGGNPVEVLAAARDRFQVKVPQ